MCGFVGFLGEPGGAAPAALERLAARMAARLESRGPDDSGVWVDARAGLALGQRRLAVIDPSRAGRQPMLSASGRSAIVYNGEVYNHPELRRALEAGGLRFRGGSDTEAVLEACEAWGVERTLPKLIGMFAFAFWDARARVLTLVRDRLGIKPLYWGRRGGVLFFGSQPKGFVDHPAWRPEVDRGALAAYLRYGYVPAPRTIYEGLEKLEPGRFVEIDSRGGARRRRYWDLRAAARGAGAPVRAADAEAALDDLLRDAVKLRTVADVPLGVFLSGGVDSSAVAALTQAESARPVRTFAVGFRDADYDEAAHARRVAAHLGCDHTEMYIGPADAAALLPGLAARYDEPFADVSQIPTCLVSELARRRVTVALSGDGGDEVFAGYSRYARAAALWRYAGGWPRPLRAAAAAALCAVPRGAWGGAARARRARTLADLLRAADRDSFCRRLVSLWPDPESAVPGGRGEAAGAFADGTEAARGMPDFVRRMQFLDAAGGLPDGILAKVDRASMGVGLEVRVPLLDHRVVEFAWRLPPPRGAGKPLLRRVLARYVPRALTDRPKMGFDAPIGRWLRGPLRDWAEALLAEDRLRRGGWLDPAPVRRAWRGCLAGGGGDGKRIWCVLMFESWRDTWGIGDA